MVKKIIYSVIIVFVVWSILDFIIHQLILGASYQATANLTHQAINLIGLALFIVLSVMVTYRDIVRLVV
jgi:hypothetical protein